MLERIARFCVRRRGLVLIAWIGILVVTSVVANGIVKADYRDRHEAPRQRITRGAGPARSREPESAGFNVADRVPGAAGGRRPRGPQARWSELFDTGRPARRHLCHQPVRAGRLGSRSAQTAPIAFAELHVADREYQEVLDLGKEIQDLGDRSTSRASTIEYGGDMFVDVRAARERSARHRSPRSSSCSSRSARCSRWACRSAPRCSASASASRSSSLAQQRASRCPTSRRAGRDDRPRRRHRLRAVHRHPLPRELARGPATRGRASCTAIDTAGRAVLFAGITVIISLLGLLLMGRRVRARPRRSRAALGVLAMMVGVAHAAARAARLRRDAASSAHVPRRSSPSAGRDGRTAARRCCYRARRRSCSFGFLASRSCPGRPRFVVKAPARSEIPHRRREATRRAASGTGGAGHPAPAVAGARRRAARPARCSPLPVLSILRSASATPATSTRTRPRAAAYDLLAEGFGPGFNGPLLVTVAGRHGVQDPEALSDVRPTRCSADRGRRLRPRRRARSRRPRASCSVYPHHRAAGRGDRPTSSTGCATTCCPTIAAVDVDVGRRSPRPSIDFADYLAGRLPLFFGAVLILSFLLLMVVFRSAARAAQGRDHEPAVDRRGVRRDRRGVPVGLGQRASSASASQARSRRGRR